MGRKRLGRRVWRPAPFATEASPSSSSLADYLRSSESLAGAAESSCWSINEHQEQPVTRNPSLVANCCGAAACAASRRISPIGSSECDSQRSQPHRWLQMSPPAHTCEPAGSSAPPVDRKPAQACCDAGSWPAANLSITAGTCSDAQRRARAPAPGQARYHRQAEPPSSLGAGSCHLSRRSGEPQQPAQLEKPPPPPPPCQPENSAQQQQQQLPLGWQDIRMRYRTMERQLGGGPCAGGGAKSRVWFKLQHSCLFQLLLSTLHFVLPILSTFKGYTLPDDLLTDLTSGITVAVLHIPQGMAYGTLAGVDPIYGLYVSLVPVLLMALMSSSRHVSYGTFAIISIMLANAADSFKAAYRLHLVAANRTAELAAVVLVNNHQAPAASLLQVAKEQQQQQVVPVEAAGELSANLVDLEMPENIEILATICLVVGLIQVVMAAMRLGVLSLVLSEQVVSGFTTASALHVITSQLAPLFDLSLAPVDEGPFKICRVWVRFASGMCAGFNRYTGTISIVSMLSLLLCKQVLEPRLKRHSRYYSFIPSELILMFILIFCSWRWKFQANYGVRIIGSIPTELPTITPPRLDIAPFVLQDAITIALFTFAMNLSLGQVYAKRFKYKIKSNQELFAIGTTNCISSFFSCFPCGSSLSRTAMQANLNVKSPLCPLVSCACILSIICYLAPLLFDLPYCALSCIVVIALKGVLAQSKDLRTYWHQSKLDALVWLVTFGSVIAFNVTLGLVIGVIASLLVIFVRLFTPDYSILGRLTGTDLFVDVDAFADCAELDQIKVIRFNSALCYLNQTIFRACVEKLLPRRAGSGGPLNFLCSNKAQLERERAERASSIRFLILDCSAFSYCDYSGVDTLIDLIQDFDERGVRVLLAACPLKLIYMIERMNHPKLQLKNIYPTLGGAVARASVALNQSLVFDPSQVSGGAPPAPRSTCSEPPARYKFTLSTDLDAPPQ